VSPADHQRYRAALEPWKRKAERERKVISHVRYHDGQAAVVMIPRREAMSAASVAPPLPPNPRLL
jgi:hypothetical protein